MSFAQVIMTKQPISIEPDATVREALVLMHGEDIRHLPVVEDGQLVGMLSDRDLRGFVFLDPVDEFLEGGGSWKDTAVSEVMSANVVTVPPETALDELIDTFLDHRVGAVPVVDPEADELIGIISYVDILRAVSER